jgi:hypothetical protein
MEREKKRLLCVIQIVRNNHEPCAQGRESHGRQEMLVSAALLVSFGTNSLDGHDADDEME